MSAPTLAYGATTVTLPYPVASPPPQRTVDGFGGSARSVGGALRQWVGPYWFTYALSFEEATQATYDSIVALLRTAANAGGAVTFTWAGGPWPSATSGVTVIAELGPQTPTGYLFGVVDFTLDLTETVARTS